MGARRKWAQFFFIWLKILCLGGSHFYFHLSPWSSPRRSRKVLSFMLFAAYAYITWVLIPMTFFINTYSTALGVVLCATQICTLSNTFSKIFEPSCTNFRLTNGLMHWKLDSQTFNLIGNSPYNPGDILVWSWGMCELVWSFSLWHSFQLDFVIGLSLALKSFPAHQCNMVLVHSSFGTQKHYF